MALTNANNSFTTKFENKFKFESLLGQFYQIFLFFLIDTGIRLYPAAHLQP